MENAYSGRVRTETKRRKDTSCNIEALLSTLVVEATLWRVPQSKFGTNRLRNKRLTAEKPIAVEWRRRLDAFVRPVVGASTRRRQRLDSFTAPLLFDRFASNSDRGARRRVPSTTGTAETVEN